MSSAHSDGKAAMTRLWQVLGSASICLGAMMPVSAQSGPAEDEAYAAFEWFCLSQLADPKSVTLLMKRIDVPALESEKAAAFLGGHEGSTWALPGESTRMVIVLTTDNVCSVVAPYVKAQPAFDNFKQKVKQAQLTTDDVGSMRSVFFAVTFPDLRGGPDQHAVAIASWQTLASSEGITFATMPEAILQREGMTIPSWP